MSNIYANHIPPSFDEVRYQTIGRGHGFDELSGVQFKINDKYDFLAGQVECSRLMENLQISPATSALAEAAAYTYDLERRVLENMEVRGS